MADVHIQRRGAAEPHRRQSFDPFARLQDLARWDPIDALGQLMAREEPRFQPTFELKELPDAFLLTADLPGLQEEDVKVDLTADRITVSGKREEEQRHENERYYTYERSYGSFSRSFTLPNEVDREQVLANLEQGVLKVRLPKRPEVQPRRIEIHANKGTAGKAKA